MKSKLVLFLPVILAAFVVLGGSAPQDVPLPPGHVTPADVPLPPGHVTVADVPLPPGHIV